MRVLIQLRTSPAIHAASRAATAQPSVTAALTTAVATLAIDPSYPPVQVPGVAGLAGAAVHSLSQPLTFSAQPADSTYLVRGQIADGAGRASTFAAVSSHPDVVGVFADFTD